MHQSRRNLIIFIVVLALLLPIIWWFASPLFTNKVVDEALPFGLPSAEAQASMTPEAIEAKLAEVMTNLNAEGAMDGMSDEDKAVAEERLMALSKDMPDKEMVDDMPEAEAEWLIAAQGEFKDADNFHKGSGTATVFQQGEQSILRFENFSATNGPDLHVLLVENIEGTKSSELGNYVDLGSLKGNMGNQNYELASDIDVSEYGGVMIYCMPFHVVFATASF